MQPKIDKEENRKILRDAYNKGMKHDSEKLRWDLLPFNILEEVVVVLTTGAKKYSDDNWKRVPRPRQRYFAAAMRHLIAWWTGEKYDRETLKSHLAHAICCLIFLLWFDKEKEADDLCETNNEEIEYPTKNKAYWKRQQEKAFRLHNEFRKINDLAKHDIRLGHRKALLPETVLDIFRRNFNQFTPE